MARPKVDESKKHKKVTISLSPKLIDVLKKHRMPASKIIELAVRKYLEI